MKFRKVDQGFRQVTRIFEADPRLSALLQSTRLQSMLDSISEQLLACQSALNQYIDDKRLIFPRLYFLSNDDLLELLGQARAGADGRQAVMQTHLKKLFPGINGVQLGPGDMSITALCSDHGEVFRLEHPVDIDCPVEVWLKNLESEMRSSLKNMTLKCVVTSSLQDQDPFSLPIQILCLAQNIRFTEQTERAIASRELHKLMSNIEKENAYYLSTEAEDQSESNKRQALILQCVHYLSIIKGLIDNNVTSISDWQWQKQLRFYLMSTKEVVAKMGLAQISYSYEYLGINTGQFVRTELADDCFLILTQAAHLGFIGNPFGPAGTGKTESVKALGALFGRLVLVFNCDEAMDSECMGRLLTGLALCGAWGCFDELNRLTADTLAAIAHQLASLLDAMQSKPSAGATALLNGKQVKVSPWCGVAGTLNPAARGYGGRRALPAALARLLRPLAAAAPPPAALAARLLAPHTPHATELAHHLHDVFTMAGALVSGCRHYDWGLRALKAAVGRCGGALASAGPLPAQRAALRRLLAANNISKLTAPDAHTFENILSLVFADVPPDDPKPDPIVSAVESAVTNLKLVYNKTQATKCLEFYEQLKQRMGVAIVGPPGSGKSTIRRLLKDALIQQGKNIVEYVICPKAMSRDSLLGSIDHDTRQWTDGVISATALEVSNQPEDVWSWVVCDGDIDPEWVEALNSVLDDNRLLTLPSGWRVQFTHNVNFIFETHSLEHASPATVSRLGIILLSDEVSCDIDYLDNWMKTFEVDNELLKPSVSLLYEVIKKCLQWLTSHKTDMVVKMYNITLVKQILTQFEYILNETQNKRTSPEEIVYSAVERIVDLIKESAVDSFHNELSSLLGPPPVPFALTFEWITDSLLMSPRLASNETVIRACLFSNNSNLLIIGPDACAKNILTEHIIKESNSTVITIECTPILEPKDIIAELKRNNVVRSGGQSNASHGARFTLVVRGLHRARADAWGTSAVHSFLLQLVQAGGFWCGAGGAWVWWGGARPRLVCAARRPPTDRLAAALVALHLAEPDDDEIKELTEGWLSQNVDKNIKRNEINTLCGTMLAMYKEITEMFTSRPHYKWNASHLKRWCENVKWYSPNNMESLVMSLTSEANMIFRDRLVKDEEKVEFNKIVRSYLKVNNNDLYFNCKLKGDGVYMESVDYGAWHQNMQKLINQCQSEYEYNVFGTSVSEVCTELAVLCPAMARACNGGVLVCVGAAGVGRRAAALITAAALPAHTYFIHHPTNFFNVFKNAISSACEGNKSLVVVCEAAVGDVTLAHVEALRAAHSPHALPPDMAAGNNHTVIDNIKQNLGIVICMDKHQRNLQDLLEKYPFVFDDGNLIWLDKWSNNTLREMPTLVVERLLKENDTEMTKEQLNAIPVEGFVKIYNSLETDTLKAPCRYLSFIRTYINIVNKKKTALMQRKNMLSAGVEALTRARSEVAKMQAEASEQEVLLSQKQAEANDALDQISATVRATTDKREEMQELKKNIELENEKLQQQKKEIELELESVEPVIAAARSAVGEIRPESLSEVRSLRAPPDVVRDVLEGVLRLMGIADTSWHSMKNFLSKRGVKEDIRCMDASQISPGALSSVQRLLESRGESFTAAVAKRASAACAPLAAWVTANVAYAAALQRVKPLQDHQRDLMHRLRGAEAQLGALAAGLAGVEARVEGLKRAVGEHSRAAAALEARLAQTHHTLHAAQLLLDHLHREAGSWAQDLEYIEKEIVELNPRSLLAAAYITYLPDATEPQAKGSISKWSALIGFEDDTFSVINFLSSVEKQLKWEAEGLPCDMSAVKNAVLVDQYLDTSKCGFTPLLVDPDGDGLSWLKNTLSTVQCDFVSQNSDKLLTAVQYAMRLGRLLVITDVDSIHETWAIILSGLPSSPNANTSIQAKLVLQCRDETLPRRLPPYYLAKLSVIQFTARLDGLTDQLIHCALQRDNPELSAKTKELKIQEAELQKQQHELQENLLRELCSNEDIVHDPRLLQSLVETRGAGERVRAALDEGRRAAHAARAGAQRLQRPARHAARLALAARALASHYPLLNVPVPALLHIFLDALPAPGQDVENNDEILKYLTRRIIERVLLALHKRDKYGVVLHLLKRVYPDLIPDRLWRIFIGNYDTIGETVDTKTIKNSHAWIPNECLKGVANLKLVDEDLYKRLSLNDDNFWKNFLSTGELNSLSKLKLSPFETVVIVAVIRPESLYRAIVAFVDQVLDAGVCCAGGAVAARRAARGAAVLLLAAHAADALAHRPLALVDVDRGPDAWQAALEAAKSSGGWLAINVAASPFTKELQSFIVNYSENAAENERNDFQLWILSEYRDIPPLVANACVNVVLEVPEGVKNNIMGTLSAWGNYQGEPTVVRLHACLALFHALVQERRAYIPQGWSTFYSWEWGEARGAARAVRGGGAALVAAWYAARVHRAPDARALRALHAAATRAAPPLLPSTLPLAADLQTYAAAFAALPDVDTPELLGLPANCRSAWEKRAADSIVSKLRELESSNVPEDKGEATSSLKSLLAAWKKWMSGSPLLKGGLCAAGGGWWGGVRRAEAAAAARAARALHAALAARARNKHAAPLTQVPEEWQLLWVGPTEPDMYLKEFCYRARSAVTRLENNIDDNYIPKEVDLRGFLQPSRVVWALRAHAAARLRTQPHRLTLVGQFITDKAPAECVIVTGVSLSGAECGADGLRAAPRDGQLARASPPLALYYRPQHEDDTSSDGMLEVPMYNNEHREELLFSVRAPLARSFPLDLAVLHAVAFYITAVQ